MHVNTKFKIVCFLVVAFVASITSASEPARIVVFDAAIVDTSLEGELLGKNPDETRRLKELGEQVRDGLTASGKYYVLDTTPVAQALNKTLDRVHYLHDCNECELPIAKSLDAQQSMVMWVQKVSNLILNFNIVIKDVHSGKVVKSSFVDIRSNTDKSWQKGIDYMLRNRILSDVGE